MGAVRFHGNFYFDGQSQVAYIVISCLPNKRSNLCGEALEIFRGVLVSYRYMGSGMVGESPD